MKPRHPVITDRTASQNLQANIPAHVFATFDYLARARGLAKSVLLRRMVEAVANNPLLLDIVIGKDRKP